MPLDAPIGTTESDDECQRELPCPPAPLPEATGCGDGQQSAPDGGVDIESTSLPFSPVLSSTVSENTVLAVVTLKHPSHQEVLDHLQASLLFRAHSVRKTTRLVAEILRVSFLFEQLHTEGVISLEVVDQDASFLQPGGSFTVQDGDKFVTSLLSTCDRHRGSRPEQIRDVFGVLRVMGVTPVTKGDAKIYCTIDPAVVNPMARMLHFRTWHFQQTPADWQRTSQLALRTGPSAGASSTP